MALTNGEVGESENGIRAVQLEHFIPLPEAAQRLNVSEDQLIFSGFVPLKLGLLLPGLTRQLADNIFTELVLHPCASRSSFKC